MRTVSLGSKPNQKFHRKNDVRSVFKFTDQRIVLYVAKCPQKWHLRERDNWYF